LIINYPDTKDVWVSLLKSNEKNRKEISEKIEVMAFDVDNDGQPFWDDLDDFLEWGKRYRLTIEEIKS